MENRLCFDLDGTICYTRTEDQSYEDVLPLPGAIESLKKLKGEGWYIIIHTARNMKTHNNNLGKVIAVQAHSTVEWLRKYEVPYDELLFGKPYVDFFIDDRGIPFRGSWEQVLEEIKNRSDNV